MQAVKPFSDEQNRVLVNLEQRYQVWMEAEQALQAMPYDLRRKEVNGKAYLYDIADRSGTGRSLGRWSPELEARFTAYHAEKTRLKARRDAARASLNESCRLYRALRLPMLASEAGNVLREADRRRLLGNTLLVVGTNAMPAYSIEAAGVIGAPDETEDFDLAWSAEAEGDGSRLLWDLLKAVDPTYTVNSERPFQARNARAYEIEILVAPSRIGSMAKTDRPKPVPLPEQEWLLLGRPVDRVIVCRDGSPARIVAPDPRWFALQKLWMAKQAKRNALKRPKDEKQGTALLDAVYQAMPQYPLDEAFARAVPEELSEVFFQWKERRGEPDAANW